MYFTLFLQVTVETSAAGASGLRNGDGREAALQVTNDTKTESTALSGLLGARPSGARWAAQTGASCTELSIFTHGASPSSLLSDYDQKGIEAEGNHLTLWAERTGSGHEQVLAPPRPGRGVLSPGWTLRQAVLSRRGELVKPFLSDTP